MFKELMIEDSKINEFYRSDNYIKPIRRAICLRRRKKLVKKIDEFSTQETFSFYDVLSLINFCADMYSPDFKEIAPLKRANLVGTTVKNCPVTTATLEYTEDKTTYTYNIDLYTYNETIEIVALVQNRKGNKTFRFENRKALTTLPSDTGFKETLIKGLGYLISELMRKVLWEMMDRSERIYYDETRHKQQ